MATPAPPPPTAATSPGDLFQLIRQGAHTRSDLAKSTGLAPSTVSLKVDGLLEAGLLTESGVPGRGGRTARRLEIHGEKGFAVSVDLGASHVQILLADLAGSPLAEERYSSDLLDADPAKTVARLWTTIAELAEDHRLRLVDMLALAVGVPAPVHQPSGRIASPAFMPTWNNAALPELFAAHTVVPVLIENDANLCAIAESSPGAPPDSAHLLAVKLGTRIGCGIVSAGVLHRGFSGAAGEIAHTPATGRATIPCSCNVTNCLESVASGGAILARLRSEGATLETTQELVERGEQGEGRSVEALRDAGGQIGAALSNFVNFFNPRELVLCGTMSSSAPLVAAIRAELFRTCLPLMTEDLEIRTSRPDTGAAAVGGLRLALDAALHPARVNALVTAAERERTA